MAFKGAEMRQRSCSAHQLPHNFHPWEYEDSVELCQNLLSIKTTFSESPLLWYNFRRQEKWLEVSVPEGQGGEALLEGPETCCMDQEVALACLSIWIEV